MNRVLTIALLISASVFALEPQLKTEPCPACHGKKSLSITPPNLGQHDGEIDVTPGKPFTNHRWDIRHEKCPLCKGRGNHQLYQLRVPTPPPEQVDGLAPCPECRWSCVTKCRKCRGTGVVNCPACNRSSYSSSSKKGKAGWVVTHRKESSSNSRSSRYSRSARRAQQQTTVTPCEKCGALAQVICLDCEGKGAVTCRKCKGTGAVPRKEPRR